ncbi:testis-specific Y-encoded-like protein 1 [Echinops telfairi]|uniref:Testis-specific Y-encoded-like protein 1 n=1 Tax=Echinops telfairi TaxID=9371 RepID=A0ABM0IKQ2_ECHTE|nr:testis-specific Y-encoded-like protein 1 [Echinops telfairi]
MSSLHGGERTPLPEACGGPSGFAPGDPGLREETAAAQLMAEAGKRGPETVAPSPPRLAAEGDAAWDPASGGRTSQTLVRGGRGAPATGAGREEAPPPSEGLGAASAPTAAAADSARTTVGEGGEPRGPGGETALQGCDAGRSASEGTVGAKAEQGKPGQCAVSPGAVDARPEVMEGKMEVDKRPVGEMDVVEEDQVSGEVNAEARPHLPNWFLRMDPLEAIQQELDTVNAQADRAFLQLEQKFGRMRRHYLERRNYIIQNIPGFWATAFRHHPQLSAMIKGQDAEMVRYMTSLEVKELREPRTGCKFKFFFRRNPYFRNKLIVKEYEVRSSGEVVSLSTPIVWRRGHEPQSFIHRDQGIICSFFTWFSDHSLPESDKIAEIIKEDLWPNPLQYYLLREGARRPRRRPIREPVELPRPFGCQSG